MALRTEPLARYMRMGSVLTNIPTVVCCSGAECRIECGTPMTTSSSPLRRSRSVAQTVRSTLFTVAPESAQRDSMRLLKTRPMWIGARWLSESCTAGRAAASGREITSGDPASFAVHHASATSSSPCMVSQSANSAYCATVLDGSGGIWCSISASQ
eukprot:983599-Prymnesium_polylepis.1